MCKLETGRQVVAGGWGAAQSLLAAKYNSQTQIALHQPQRALRGLSVAVSGDLNWHTEVPPLRGGVRKYTEMYCPERYVVAVYSLVCVVSADRATDLRGRPSRL